MTEQVREIVDNDYFKAMYNSGISRSDIARYFGVPVRVISNACEFAGLRPPSPHDLAPTPEEEEASRNSLELAPMVRAATEEIWRNHLEQRRNESDSASLTRGWAWREEQQPRTYSIFLDNGRRLA